MNQQDIKVVNDLLYDAQKCLINGDLQSIVWRLLNAAGIVTDALLEEASQLGTDARVVGVTEPTDRGYFLDMMIPTDTCSECCEDCKQHGEVVLKPEPTPEPQTFDVPAPEKDPEQPEMTGLFTKYGIGENP
jgi:hypothetical protein